MTTEYVLTDFERGVIKGVAQAYADWTPKIVDSMGGAYDSGWHYAIREALATITNLLESTPDEAHALAYTTALESVRALDNNPPPREQEGRSDAHH